MNSATVRVTTHTHTHTHSALLSVQVELVLADGHDPDGFDQRMAGIPRVDLKACLPEGAFGHCPPVARMTPGFNHNSGEIELLTVNVTIRLCVY